MNDIHDSGTNGTRSKSRRMRQVAVSAVLIYCCAWLVMFGILKQSQQDWSWLYIQNDQIADISVHVSKLPEISSQSSPHAVQTPDSATPPNSMSPFIWDLVSAWQQVKDGKQSMKENIDNQTQFASTALDNLKTN